MLLDFSRLGALRYVLAAIGGLVGVFLLLPIALIVALSFGSSQWLQFPPPAWTLKWYRQLLADPDWLAAFLTSLKIALTVTVLATGLGLMASFGLTRGRFPGREFLRALFLTPMVLPVVVLAVALYALFLRLHLNGSFAGFVIAHLVVALPFAIISICNALERFDKTIEDAAVLCGASPLEAKLRVTIPAIRLGLFGAAIFSFLASWDEVVIAIFMASPDLQTLPVRIFSTLRQDLSPVIAAVSALLVGFTMILMLAAAFLRRDKP
ncbi:ABC transporter permease [Labrys wisconsinensis]|uniref:Spermidine/putrescine transport system permease protein n=1 Tax=Labrys wisconsinensis TaxID=425677 RepID=A0ABU0JM54_9HYPH|nr:ABC transporter permease [Labrys wisconsinensis]MDQ0475354.1 putative spermidine/putrescine transport system permease protein [Labrys wisconsinensis]